MSYFNYPSVSAPFSCLKNKSDVINMLAAVIEDHKGLCIEPCVLNSLEEKLRDILSRAAAIGILDKYKWDNDNFIGLYMDGHDYNRLIVDLPEWTIKELGLIDESFQDPD